MAGEINKAVQWALSIAENNAYTYVWGGWGLADGGYDCGHFVIEAYQNAGVFVRSAGATFTGDMRQAFLKCGFQDVTASVNLKSGTGLKKGDVLLNESKHSALVQEDGGKTVEAHGKEKGIVAGYPYRNYPWDCVLRYTKDVGTEEAYTNFPCYKLSDSAILDIATMITGEQGGEDVLACRQEASQLANLNEVTRGRSNTEADIIKTLHDGWYSASSWKRGCTQTAVDAARFVLIDGKRVLPRYVTEHDTFPGDIQGAKERRAYTPRTTKVKNVYGSEYTFYAFFGSQKDKDIAGYFEKDYKKYSGDVPYAPGMVPAGGSAGGQQSKQITASRIASEAGGRGEVRNNPVRGKNTLGGEVELYIINHDGKIMFPVVSGTVNLESCRRGSPGKLSFSVLKTAELDFLNGAQVVLKSRGIEMFYGFVFEKEKGKDDTIKVTAYDQMRYFKNKDCYVYENKTAAELVKMIADDHNLVCGALADTGYKIPLRVEDNATLFDIVQNAFDQTLYQTGEMFVLYDDFGKLCIKNPKDWIFDLVIDEETALNYTYQASINDDVYSRIKLYYDNEETGEREVYIHNNEEKINRWGVLQMCDSIDDGEDGASKAALLAALYGQESRSLEIKDAFGSPLIRGGCSVCVMLNVGERIINHFMLVESVKHKFSGGNHRMDLTLLGGDIQNE